MKPMTAGKLAVATMLVVGAVWAGPLTAASTEDDAKIFIRRMIEAHGGMEPWATAPTVSFTDEWRRGDGEEGAVSKVVVEQGARRAYIEVPGTDMRLAWDGEKAWSVDWERPTPPRFLALLNYYFLNLPWLTLDPGVVLGEPGRAQLPDWADDETEYVTIRMTFGEGVGDTPRDYYVLYIDPVTYRLEANEYIVTYRALLPEGVEASPPHLLIYDELEEVEGLLVPTRFTIYELDGTVYASCAIDGWSFRERFDEERLEMPEGAVVDPSRP